MTNTTAPMLGAIANGTIGKSESWTRLDYRGSRKRRLIVANHITAARRRTDRAGKRAERRAWRAEVAAEVAR